MHTTDTSIIYGEDGRPARIAYHESINGMYPTMNAMKLEGKSIEERFRYSRQEEIINAT